MPTKKIRTVLGDIDVKDLGRTNCHAHVEVDVCAHHFDERYMNHRLRYEDVIPDLKEYKAGGGSTICELTPMGLGRNPSRIAQVSRETGVQIIMGTGIYHEMFHPYEIRNMDEDLITQMLIRDITIGIENTGIKAGMIGEQGTYTSAITEREAIIFRASATAAKETGVAISTHTHAGELGVEQAEFLLREGVSPKKIIIGHLDDKTPLRAEVKLMRELLALGVWIQFDDIGFDYFTPALGVQMPSDQDRVEILAEFIADGFENQIVLGSDVCKASHLKSQGGPGFVHLVTNFSTIAKDYGISEATMNKLLIENPAQVLSF
jgi:phosphotriesterase-related protein